MNDTVTEQKNKKTMMQLALSVESCLLIRKQRTDWDKCMNVREGTDDYVCGFLMLNKAKPTAFRCHTVVD
jgi:hypothetical protein